MYGVPLKGELMNDAIFDIQNMRKSILNCTQNMRVEDDTDRLFVKSLCLERFKAALYSEGC